MKVLYQNNQEFDFKVHSKKSLTVQHSTNNNYWNAEGINWTNYTLLHKPETINWSTKTINWKTLTVQSKTDSINWIQKTINWTKNNQFQ